MDSYRSLLIHGGEGVSLYRNPGWKRYEVVFHTPDEEGYIPGIRITDEYIEKLSQSPCLYLEQLLISLIKEMDNSNRVLYNQEEEKSGQSTKGNTETP